MKKYSLIFLFTVSVSTLFGWYPDYTILATDFKLRDDFLTPTRIHSVGMLGLGRHFVGIYQSPLDDVFQNPAYLGSETDHFIYMDLAGDEYQSPNYTYPVYGYGDPYYWSPYNVLEPSKEKDPIFRIVSFGKTPALPLRFGLSGEVYYNEEEFYRPYWYWGGWYEDAAGDAYDDEMIDPYEDYTIVESNENTDTNMGVRFNGFLAFPVFPGFTLGVGATIHGEVTEGDYTNYDFRDDSDYTDDYLRFSDNKRSRTQDFQQKEFRAGLVWSPHKSASFGMAAGYVPGSIDRSYSVNDSSRYRTVYYYDAPDSSVYLSSSQTDNEKEWNYDGHSAWITTHGDFTLFNDLTLRFSIHSEQVEADYTGSEQYTKSRSYYYHYSDRTYESESWAVLDRIGRGNITKASHRFSLGADWKISSAVRFLGGFVLEYKNEQQTAEEPFVGEKYAETHYENVSWANFDDKITHSLDDKKYVWDYQKTQTTLAIPVGAFVRLHENFEFQFGLTKELQQLDLEERYDLVVYQDSTTTSVDGSVTVESDSAYVDGHILPGDHRFTNQFCFNAGFSIRYKERFRLTAIISESIVTPRTLKIGAQILW